MATSVGQVVAPMVFIMLMIAIFFVGMAASQILDPSLWVPKRSGLGWTVDFANPHARLVFAFVAAWLALLFAGLAGLNQPDTLVAGGLMQWLRGLLRAV